MKKKKVVDTTSLNDLSKAEFGELLLTIMIGLFVRSSVACSNNADWQRIEDQLKPVLLFAEQQGFTDLIQYFHGQKLPIDMLEREEERILEAFKEEEFWDTLEVTLGQRDFFAELSPNIKKDLQKEFWLPEKVHTYYDKYRKEFEKHGVARLHVVPNNPKNN